jgi:hypothetical protein
MQNENVVTIVARNKVKLDQLKCNNSNVNIIDQDYIHVDVAIKKIEEAIESSGIIDLAILWIHSTGNVFRIKLKDLLINENPDVKIFELSGSASIKNLSVKFDELGEKHSFNYRKIILGHKFSQNNFRWLNDGEICEGTLYAIENDKPFHVIGTLEGE